MLDRLWSTPLAFQIYPLVMLSSRISSMEQLVVRHGEDSVTFHVYPHRSLREVDENAIHCINWNLSWTLELRNR